MGPTEDQIRKFWSWFAEERRELIRLLDSGDAARLAALINARLEKLYPNLQWEMGPGVTKEFQFVISPGGHLELRPMIRDIIGRAPLLEGWEFYSSRQPCPNRLSITLPDSRQTISAENWSYTMHHNPISGKLDITLHDRELSAMEPKEQLRTALLILDSLLGEDLIEDWLGEVDFTAGGVEGKARPIQDLTRFVRSIAAHHVVRTSA